VKKIKPNFKKARQAVRSPHERRGGPHHRPRPGRHPGPGKNGYLQTRLGDQPLTITVEDVEIASEDIPGWIVAAENGLTVALDTTISDDLRKEGIARDVVNRVQNLRKDMGLEVQDKIRIDVQLSDGLVNAALEANREYICTETQALELNLKPT
jgi:isoleucyl-tRNA synthetase